MVSTEYIRQQIGHFRDGIAAYGLGDLYEDELAVFEECLAYREGYDPQERLPEPKPGLVVWCTWQPVLWEPCAQACETADDVAWISQYAARWYPIPGGA